jgi:hypothetical protein
MPSPSYEQNKKHIYIWRENNKEKHNIQRVRAYYRKKIATNVSKVWCDIMYEYLDILRED